MKKISKTLSWVILALAMVYGAEVKAQDFSRSEQVFGWLQNDVADSLYSVFAPELKAQISESQLRGIFRQLESQAGALQRCDGWSQSEVQGMRVDERPLHFAHMSLVLRLVYNAKNELAGFFFTPYQAPKAESADSLSLRHDGISLPAEWKESAEKKNAKA
ncbi:MAG: DUF3887 domain-containing protein [Alloprevotella sp.]|nr:DUF3887 domain-containing protein [Alloprevotella sp.]